MKLDEFLKLHSPEKTKFGKLCRALQSDPYLKGSTSDKLAIISTYKARYGRVLLNEFFFKLKKYE